MRFGRHRTRRDGRPRGCRQAGSYRRRMRRVVAPLPVSPLVAVPEPAVISKMTMAIDHPPMVVNAFIRPPNVIIAPIRVVYDVTVCVAISISMAAAREHDHRREKCANK